jgi:hypothetical protein
MEEFAVILVQSSELETSIPESDGEYVHRFIHIYCWEGFS